MVTPPPQPPRPSDTGDSAAGRSERDAERSAVRDDVRAAEREAEPAAERDAERDAPLGSWRKVYLLVALFAVAWMLLLWWLTGTFNVRLPR